MRKLLVTSFFALTLLISAAPVAHAAVVCSVITLGQSCDPGNGSAGICRQSPDDGSYGCGPVVTNAAPGTYGAQAADAQAQAAAAKTATDNGPKMDEALGGVMTWIMSLFAWLLGVAVITLDSAVYYTVVTMGDYVNKLSAVGVTWRILRDIGNIALIFGFLAVGITTILNVNWYGSGSKMLPKMLMAAVFLNFSLFITEAIIDTGNLFATQFYTQINGGKLPTGTLKWDDIGNAGKTGIAGKIMNQLGLATIYSSALTKKDVLPSGTSIFIGFMSIILFIVAAFVMFSLAFVLIARFVALIFLIILAPIGFAGLAIPQLAAKAEKWWDTLFEQTITAPILLLMLYIALAIITDANFLGFGPKGDWTGFVPGNGGTNFAGFASMLLSFLVAMGLLMAVVVQSKNLSAVGAAGASKLAGKLSFGATAWAGRGTVGWAANRAAKSLRGTAFGRVPLVGTGLVRGLDKVATGSFDVRGTSALKNFPGGGIDAGAAQKGGYKADLKARTESRVKYAGEITGRELTDDEKVEQTVLQNKIKALQKQRGKAGNTVVDINKIDADIKEIEEGKEGKGEKGTLKNLERGTAKDNQSKYASVLELGMDPKGFFNRNLNFAANTDAAKTIRTNAKKGKPDKDWSDNMKKLLKEAGGEEGGGDDKGPEGGGPKGGGRGTTTPSAAGNAAPAGHQQNPGGNIVVPTSVGNGPRHS